MKYMVCIMIELLILKLLFTNNNKYFFRENKQGLDNAIYQYPL